MNTFSGLAVLILTAGLYFKYQPRLRSSLCTCLLSGVLGLTPLFLTDGPLTLQLAQHFMQAIVLLCCFVKLRKEQILVNRRKARLKGCKRGKLSATTPQTQSQACA